MSQQRAQRGFTLTEVMVGIAVFTLIFIAALLLYDRANKVFRSSMQSSDVQQNTRVAFERLMAEVRMAGFDYDRDGYPQGSLKYQQPDEQLEYIHARAITFRSNLDYESDAATDNGRETAYEPGFTTTASTTDDYFPIVTTGNDEIVTYFLRSENSAANDDSITFYADVQRPRRTFPVTGTGQNESLVTISNVDLCQNSAGVDTGCLNPPYTLMRVTLNADGTVGTPLPVATNVRSIRFQYFKDSVGTEVQAPNGGAGQVMVTGGTTTTASIAARDLRANIRSMHVELVGMSETGDSDYRDPIELAVTSTQQVASAAKHRQYRLESTLVPRNLGKRGLQEIDTKAPGQPDISAVCAVGCGVVKVKWNAPNTGTVTAYTVVYDTSATGTFNSATTDAGRNLYAYVSGLTPGTQYFFRVIAENAHGSMPSTASTGVTVVNRTQPEAPTLLRGSGGTATGAPAAIANNINVLWTAPQNNITFNGVAPTNSCGEGETAISSQPENSGYIVKRSTTAGFDPATTGTIVYEGPTGAGGLTADTVGNVTYVDSSQKLNCSTYYYAVRTKEVACSTVAARNSSGDVGQAFSPWSAVTDGASTAAVAPAVPVNPTVLAGSTCATNPCTINVQWPEVVTDANGVSIWVANYLVRRRTYINGVYQTGSETIVPVTDSTIGNGTVSWTDNTAVPPATGTTTIYYYAVAARQCSTFTSTYSTTEARFPCANLTFSPGGTSVVDGTGIATDPWLIGGDIAQLNVTSSINMVTATASIRQYPSGTAGTASSGLSLTDPRQASWSYTMTGSGNVWEITVSVTDTDGCTATERRYFQETPAACCLSPYKDATGTVFDASVVALQTPAPNSGPMTYTVNLKNLCDDVLTISSIKMLWLGFGTTGSANNVVSYTLPHATTGTVTTASADSDGAFTITPSGVTNAKTTIAADGTYAVTFTFGRAQDTTAATIDNLCVRYTRNGTTFEDCKIIQIAGTTCPP